MPPRKTRIDLTAEALREMFSYDPETGHFVDLRQRPGRRSEDGRAGSIHKKGYRYIRIYGKTYRASRLAWLYVHGRWPNGQAEHEDRDRANDRIANLREATNSQNMANRAKNKNSKSPYKGVYFRKSKGFWIVRIQKDGVRKEFSGFKTAEAAAEKYRDVSKTLFGEFSYAG